MKRTPTIASFANATHNHKNAAGGGLLDPQIYPINLLAASGAIDPHTAAFYVITKAGVAALTLAAPTVTASPTRSRARRRSRSAIRRGVPEIRSSPRTSRNASSIDIPSTSGAVSSKRSNNALLASV